MNEFPKYTINHDGTNNTVQIMSKGRGIEFYAGPKMVDFTKEMIADANRISHTRLAAMEQCMELLREVEERVPGLNFDFDEIGPRIRQALSRLDGEA